MEAFSVELQEPSVVYMSLKTGECFTRNSDAFNRNFMYISDPQENITPKVKK